MIDENNLRLHGPKGKEHGADHEFLQEQRPADVVGLYGGLTSTIPRLYKVAQFYKDKGVVTIAGGQHFVEDNIVDALSHGIDYLVIGEGEETIGELLEAIEGKRDVNQVKGIAFLKNKELIFTAPREPLLDFDKLPLPDFSLVRYANIKVYPVERIRGCGMECEFCTVKGEPGQLVLTGCLKGSSGWWKQGRQVISLLLMTFSGSIAMRQWNFVMS